MPGRTTTYLKVEKPRFLFLEGLADVAAAPIAAVAALPDVSAVPVAAVATPPDAAALVAAGAALPDATAVRAGASVARRLFRKPPGCGRFHARPDTCPSAVSAALS
jgi:hypothetical protein